MVVSLIIEQTKVTKIIGLNFSIYKNKACETKSVENSDSDGFDGKDGDGFDVDDSKGDNVGDFLVSVVVRVGKV